MLKSIFKFSFFTVISKISGFVRDIALVGALGVGPTSDAFFIAFRLPNLFRAIFADGALNVVFTPMYSRKQAENSDKKSLNFFVNNTFTILIIVTTAFCAISMLLMPVLLVIFAPGLDVDSRYFTECLNAAYIMFPYLLLAALNALLSGVLQAHDKSGFVSLSPIILNACMIAASVKSIISHNMVTIAWSVIIAGIIQLILGLFFVKFQANHIVRPVIPRADEDTSNLLHKITPAILGSCATRISIWIDTVIASIVPGAVSYIYYADRLYQIPRSLVGVAISYVILPELSRAVKEGDNDSAHLLLNRALEIGFILCIPAAVGLTLLSERAAELLLTYGGLRGQDHIDAIARIITIFSIAIPSVTSVTILNTMFFADGNTKIPVKLSFISIAVNAILNLILIHHYSYISVPIATATGSWLNFTMLFYNVRKYFNFNIDARLLSKIGMACVSSCVMGFVVCFTELICEKLISGHIAKLSIFLMLCGMGVMSYIIVLKLTKTYTIHDIKNMFSSKKSKPTSAIE